MSVTQNNIISKEEAVARLIHQEWLVDGQLQQTAFALRNGETYLSVNRLAIDSYEVDVAAFISKHPEYKSFQISECYYRALLNVGDVRNITISLNEQNLNVDVEVEPRSSHIKSHAGIFARIEGKNVKGGIDSLDLGKGKIVPTMAIHQKLRWYLLHLAKLELCQLKINPASSLK